MLPFFAIPLGWLLMGMLTFRIWIRRCEVQNIKGVWHVKGWSDSSDPWFDFWFAIILSFVIWPVIWAKVIGLNVGIGLLKSLRALFTLGLRLPEKEALLEDSTVPSENVASTTVVTRSNSHWA